MINVNKSSFYILTFIQTLFFLPFFLQSNIGSDWDAYSLIGTYLIFEESGQYFPSRPPGFPVYELLVGLISKFSFLGIEKSLLLLQYIIMILLNYLIFLFFQKRKDSNILIFIIILFSPIYLISSFTVIDYTFGALFGFLSIFVAQYGSKRYRLIIPLFLAISIGARLSNIIFLIAVLISLHQKNIKLTRLFNTLFYTVFLCVIFYAPTHLKLFQYLKNLGYKTSELLCIFNLTNIELFYEVANYNYLFIRLGNVLVIFGLFYAFERFLKHPLVSKIGQNTLSIYIIHFIILYGSFTGYGLNRIIGKELNPKEVIFGGILFLLIVSYISINVVNLKVYLNRKLMSLLNKIKLFINQIGN